MTTQTGYKASELGEIPLDWEIGTIGKDCVLKARIGWQSLRTDEYLESGEYGLITGTDFNNGLVDWKTCSFVSEWRYKQDTNIQLKVNDVLITKDGTIGKLGYINELPFLATLNSGIYVVRPKNSNLIEPMFLFYLFSSEYFNNFISVISAGSTITHLYQKDFVNFQFPLPSKSEQTAIATALSNTDALISSLQKLIAKKKAIKLSAMQNLLSGKILLPEFAQRLDGSPKTTRQTELGLLPEDWKVVELGDVLSLVLNKKVDAPFFTFIGMQDVSEEAKIINQTVLPITQLKSGLTYFEENDVLVAKITPCFENGKGGYAHNLKTQIGFGSTEFHILRANQQADAEFIYYWTISPKFRQQLALDMVGSAGHKRVPFQALQKFKIPLPSKPEQTAIAQLLSDMDAEIEALECRLKKMQSLKQGMMQTLLTGKIRLPLE